MRTLKHLDLFSGIGGFAHGLRMAGGFETVAFCEIEPYCQQILRQNFGKHIPVFEDIHDLTADTIRAAGIGDIGIITAGFPCQPFSTSGKQQGTKDERFLWPELYRVITDVGPEYIILENVPRLLSIQNGLVFGGILFDLAQGGYDVEWQVLPASAFGAWHRRDRLWIVAYATGKRRSAGRSYRQRGHVPPDRHGHPTQDHPPRDRRQYRVRALGSVDADAPALRLQGWTCTPVSRPEKELRPEGLCPEISDALGVGRQRGRSDRFIFAPAHGRAALLERHRATSGWREWSVEPRVGRVVNGLPNRVDRVKALGNSVVPQIVAYIGELIQEHHEG